MTIRGIQRIAKKTWQSAMRGDIFNAELAKTVGVSLLMLVGIALLERAFGPWLFKGVGLSYLYFVPIWFSARQGGRVAGFLTCFATATSMTMGAEASWPLIAWFTNVLLLSAVMAVFVHFERRIASVNEAARTDGLTGLLNRRAFITEAKRALVRTVREYSSASLVLLDCNRFKQINDMHGHASGDEALKIVARALLDAGQGDDVVGRLGGDEFVVLLSDSDSVGANMFLNRLRGILGRSSSELPFDLSVSAGIAYFGEDARSLDQLMAVADEKMYRNKQRERAVISIAEVAEKSERMMR